MTEKTETKKAVKPEAKKAPVSHNPTFLEWPTDVWGLTKDLKKAVVALANRVKGQPDKKALVEATLEVALAHIEARYTHDSKLREARIEKAEAESEGVKF